jgi:hypothetical protein
MPNFNCFTFFLLEADGTPRIHSTHDTLPQAVNQTGIAPPGQGWRIVDNATGQIVGAGMGKLLARRGKPTKPAAVKKKPLKRMPARPEGRRSKNPRR